MKEKEAVERSFRDIPDDILIQIFKTLPPKSIAKAISVSKHWHRLIDNFIINLTRPKILFTSDHFVCGGLFLLSSNHTQSHVEELQLHVDKTLTANEKLKFFGSCNGLVLIEAGDCFYIWNPLTKYTEEVSFSVTIPSYFASKLVLGLCHDSFASKYKVVVAVRGGDNNNYSNAYVSVVCSRAATSVKVDFGYSFRLFRPGPVLNENLHFILETTSNSRECIIAFDPMVDLFNDVGMPEPRRESGDVLLGLGVLGGCLCMARKESPSIKTSNIDILIMKDYGVASSWVITCSIRNLDSLGFINTLVPLCYNNNGEALVHVNGQRIKTLYISEGCLEEVGGLISEHCQYSAVFYEEKFGTPNKKSQLVSFRVIYYGLVWVQLLTWVFFR